eukprot:50643_1
MEEAFCVYKSTRFLRVKNPRLVCVYYTTLFLVLCYIVVYLVWLNHGYQSVDPVTGTVSVKLKGTGSVPASGSDTFGLNKTIFDAMDLVVPNIEEDAFFITTSMILTPNQSRGLWSGNGDCPACSTANASQACPRGSYSSESQGIWTGNCGTTGRCEVYGWGPPEQDTDKTVVDNVGTFTAFVKVDASFSDFGVSRSNTLDKAGNGHPVYGYNLFSVDQILSNATKGVFTTVGGKVQTKGAIILMQAKWDCDLDQSEANCDMKWLYFRLDNQTGSISAGFNYRSVSYDSMMEHRLLRKLYGIRVVFTVTGQARRFSFGQLCITFGAGVAYMGVATVLTDIVLQNFLPNSRRLAAMKNREHDDMIHDAPGPAGGDYTEMSHSDTGRNIVTQNE